MTGLPVLTDDGDASWLSQGQAPLPPLLPAQQQRGGYWIPKIVSAMLGSIKSGATLPGDVATGKFSMSDPNAAGRVADMAGLVTGGAGAAPAGAGEVRMGASAAGKLADALVMRDAGHQVATDAVGSLTQPGHFYRGMTEDEYNATVGAGRGVSSAQHFSTPGEGTSFADDAGTAESYANYGHTDPRQTGRPNYLVEVRGGDGLNQSRDGYYKAAAPIPQDRITRVLQMGGDDGGRLIGSPISFPPGSLP